MANPTYRIKDWDRCFENSESRKIKSLSWTPFPNKHDTAPFRRVAALKNAPDVFCAWILIVQVASRMPERGVLANSSGPLTAEDLSLMTGFPERIFGAAFAALVKPGIQWILTTSGESPGVPGNLPASRDMSGLQGTEQNRTEGQGREQKEEAASRPDPLFLNPDFCVAWEAWEATRTGKKKLTDHARALNLAEVNRLSGGDVGTAIQIVNQTVRNAWAGFFELKGNQNGRPNQNGHESTAQRNNRKLGEQLTKLTAGLGKVGGDEVLPLLPKGDPGVSAYGS